MKQPVFFRIYFDGHFDTVKQFTEDQIVVGRSPESQLKLTDESVSPVHAVVERRDAGYYISDLGSQLGTLKNGIRVVDEPLNSGDELQFGPYRVEFFIGVPKPTQAPKGVATTSERPSLPVIPPPVINSKKAEPVRVAPVSIGVTPKIPEGPYGPNMRISKGSVIEVTVMWQDKALGTYHYNERRAVTIGSNKRCDIQIPMLGTNFTQFKLLELTEETKIFLTPEMTGDHFKGDVKSSVSDLRRRQQIVQSPEGQLFILPQNESIRLGLHGDLISVYIRYVNEVPPPILGPLFDLTASESTAVLMSVVIAAIFGLYMMIYTPKPPEDKMELEEKLRRATITFNVPKKKIVKVEEAPPQQKKIVKVEEKVERTTTKASPGQAAELAKRPKPKKAKIVSSAVKQGGSIMTGKPAASAKSETRDVSKMGLLSTFGGKGAQKELSKAYSGTGELIGDAAKATGFSGSADSRAGESLGGRLKDVGAGGKGSSTYGIAGVGTQGKGTGTFGGGTGGIGKKGKVDLNIGESEAEFTGTIDKEAIRRVIRENIKLFENCYNQALRRNSGAYGKVAIKWHIEERGRATKAVVNSNTVGDRQMGECLTRVIRSLTFPEPPPDQIAEVVYPFVFAAQ